MQRHCHAPTLNVPVAADPPFSLLAATFTSFLCIIFGANAVAIKFSLQGLGPFTNAGIRFTLAAGVIVLWARLTRHRLSLRRGQMRQVVILSLSFVLQMSLLYLGLSKTNASRGTLLVNLQPFFVLLLGHFFIPGESMSPRKVSGLLLGFIGIAFVFWERQGVSTALRTGDLMVLLSAFIWASRTVYIKRIISTFEPFQIVVYPMIFSIPLFLLQAVSLDAPMVSRIEGSVVAALLYQSLITASFGFVAWNQLLLRYGAVALHSFIFIMPIAGVALGGVLLNEPITPNLLVALGLVVSGILVVHVRSRAGLRVITFLRGL